MRRLTISEPEMIVLALLRLPGASPTEAGKQRVWLIWCTPHDPGNVVRSTLAVSFPKKHKVRTWYGTDAKAELYLHE